LNAAALRRIRSGAFSHSVDWHRFARVDRRNHKCSGIGWPQPIAGAKVIFTEKE
jgi:hypothetical protein